MPQHYRVPAVIEDVVALACCHCKNGMASARFIQDDGDPQGLPWEARRTEHASL
jgi:hypothetical protein